MASFDANRPIPRGLAPYWDGSVAAFATLPANPIDEGQKERHRMYSLVLMAILFSQWNGNKYGPQGDYGIWRTDQQLGRASTGEGLYSGGTYLGHNIAALAVDGEGRIIDYDFNHNNVFDSSAEHAEARLVRRLFALNRLYDPWAAVTGEAGAQRGLRPRHQQQVYATAVTARAEATQTAEPRKSSLLSDVTIYTSLESCAQCSGIMTLGSVKEVVYLQWDQGEFLIGNLMYKATASGASGFIAPKPIPADQFDFPYFGRLNEANTAFEAAVLTSPFYSAGTFRVASPSVTSFLCTDLARRVYSDAAGELAQWSAATYPDYLPAGAPLSSFTNRQVLAQVKDFLAYARKVNNRGTPHGL
ncbi:MAG: hypothetical protein NVSMB32_06500 [Actinomycetota bacterium]